MIRIPPPRPALGQPGSIKAARRAAAKPTKPKVAVTPPTLDGKQVEIVVPMPKDVRKQVRDKAERLGVTPEEAIYRVLLSWVSE